MIRLPREDMNTCCAFLIIAKYLTVLFLLGLSSLSAAQEANDIAIVTALQGNANRISPQGTQALQPFSRLRQGDQLLIDRPSLLKLVYFNSGRQEIWRGKGMIEIIESESKGVGFSVPEVKTISSVMAKQIAKSPPADASVQNSRPRMRSINGGGSIASIDESYRRMRMEAAQGDLNPELFLLSALFEIREIERVEQALSDLQASRPADQEARMVITLYQKAVKNYKEGVAKK